MVRSGWLNRAHLLQAVGSKYSQVRLMLVEKCGELEAVNGLRGTEFGSKLDKAQQASSNSVGNKEGREKSTGLDGDQRRPFSCRTVAEVSRQTTNRRMFHPPGARKLGTKPLLD